MANRFMLILCASLLLSACLPKQQQLDIQTYLFSAKPMAAQQMSADVDSTNKTKLVGNNSQVTTTAAVNNRTKKPSVKIISFTAVQPFNSRFFIFRVAPTHYQQDYYHRFLTDPTRQLQAIMMDQIKQSDEFSQVLDNDDASHTNYLIKFILTKLYVDVTAANQARAVIGLEVQLRSAKNSSNGSPLFIDRNYIESVPINNYDKGAHQIVLAWDQGITYISKQIISECRQQFSQK